MQSCEPNGRNEPRDSEECELMLGGGRAVGTVELLELGERRDECTLIRPQYTAGTGRRGAA
jgi:hypothetical protein